MVVPFFSRSYVGTDPNRNESEYLRAAYNETQVRTDFIAPFLEIFGWDVQNRKGHPPALREVFEEATVEVGEERLSKKPDYELRLARQRKLFVEAKKPSIRIDRDKASAFQVRRYGYRNHPGVRIHSGAVTQSIIKNRAYAEAYAEVLRSNGIACTVGSRLD